MMGMGAAAVGFSQPPTRAAGTVDSVAIEMSCRRLHTSDEGYEHSDSHCNAYAEGNIAKFVRMQSKDHRGTGSNLEVGIRSILAVNSLSSSDSLSTCRRQTMNRLVLGLARTGADYGSVHTTVDCDLMARSSLFATDEGPAHKRRTRCGSSTAQSYLDHP